MNDLEFAQKCAGGNKQAWDEFIDKYSRLIYNYINSVLKQKNPDLLTQENIDDIFQEIFLSLSKDNFRRLRSFKAKNGCSLASWLRQVTINYVLDYLRKFRSVVSLEEHNEDEFPIKDMITDSAGSVRNNLNAQEKLLNLKECIEKLDTDDKYFLEFYINQGVSLEVMKDILNISRAAIDMRRLRIVEKLKECFKDRGFETS